MPNRVLPLVALPIFAATLMCRSVAAQSGYFNLESAHPVRVEDALPTERFGLDLHFPVARYERLDTGAGRWRFEPSFSYGLLPRTSVEVRSSFVYREASATPRGGLAGIGVSALHALNTETTGLPAFALAGEMYQPAGSAKSGGTAVAVRAITTRTTSFGRVHLNASYGTFNVAVVRPVTGCTRLAILLGLPCGGGGAPPVIPDGPCSLQELGDAVASLSTPPGPVPALDPAAGALIPAPPTVPLTGHHWLAGVGVDHALPLRSTLLVGDLFAERYVGLFNQSDWTAEAGVRHQLTPLLTLDASAGRHFHGVTRSWIFTLGASRSTSLSL